MGQLNFFLPYNKGTENHEDHLTRAFLLLLKHSNIILQQFYNYTLSKTENNLKPSWQMTFDSVIFETQVGSLPEVNTYVSILITNEHFAVSNDIITSDRKAVYDGVINFNDDVVFFIETKPYSNNVWEAQLCPSKKDIPEGAELISKASVLEWKQIINILHNLNSPEIISKHERLLIADFFEFINLNFDYLNPYNELSKCHSNYLANKRLEQILQHLSFSAEAVKRHYGWGYCIELGFPEIRKIALLLHYDINEIWDGVSIGADFGSTVTQARNFYSNIESSNQITNLNEFDVYCNLHLAFKNQNLVFLKSTNDAFERYFDYWKEDVWGNFGGIPKEILIEKYLMDYVKNGLIIYDEEAQRSVSENIINKGYTRINICPAIYLEHFISREKAIELDKKGTLISYVYSKMIEVLGILPHNLESIIQIEH